MTLPERHVSMSMSQIKDLVLPALEAQLRAYKVINNSEVIQDIVFGYKDMEEPLPLILKLEPKETRVRK